METVASSAREAIRRGVDPSFHLILQHTLHNKKTYKRLALVAAMGLLILFVRHIDFGVVQNKVVQIGWKFGLVFLITGIAYALASIAWLLCFQEVPAQLSASKLFIYRQIGETLSTINPANIIVGESAKMYLLKQEGIAYDEGVTSILLSRILIFLSMVALFLLLPFVIYQLGWIPSFSVISLLGILLFSICIMGLFFSMVHPKLLLYQTLHHIASQYKIRFLNNLLPKIYAINQLLCTFYQEQRGKLIIAFLLSVLHWLMGAVEIYALLFFLDIKITLLGAILVEVGVTGIKSMGAFIPGQIGIEEYGNKVMLGLLDISAGSIWLTISILRRTRQLIWLLIGGVFFLLVYRKV